MDITQRRQTAFTQIWFLVEGQSVRWRCDHSAGWFRLGPVRDLETEVVCTYNKRHWVRSGFYLEPPVPTTAAVEPHWIGKLLRGEQLSLTFRGRPLRFPPALV